MRLLTWTGQPSPPTPRLYAFSAGTLSEFSGRSGEASTDSRLTWGASCAPVSSSSEARLPLPSFVIPGGDVASGAARTSAGGVTAWPAVLPRAEEDQPWPDLGSLGGSCAVCPCPGRAWGGPAGVLRHLERSLEGREAVFLNGEARKLDTECAGVPELDARSILVRGAHPSLGAVARAGGDCG